MPPDSKTGRRPGLDWHRGLIIERGEARVQAATYFAKFPKAAYMTEIESWRELSGGRIEFTIRRLPSAD